MSLSTQLATMLAMVGMGGWIGMALDTYGRVFRKKSQRMWLVFMTDILFWIVQALLIFYVLYLVNNGEVGFYIILAIVCGFSAYQSLFKTIYMHILERLLSLIKWVYRLVKRIVTIFLIKPIVFIFTGLFQIALWIGKGMYILIRAILRIIYRLLIFFLRPFFHFAKYLWNFLPESFRIRVTAFFKTIKNISVKTVQFIKTRIKRK